MQKNPNFSMEDMKKLLSTPDGIRLLTLLRRDGGDTLMKAFAAVQAGDTETAKNLLSPLLDNPETKELLSRLGGR